MTKLFTLLFGTFLLFTSLPFCAAQSNILDNKDSLKYYLNKTSFNIDKDADAVILYESGNSTLIYNTLGKAALTYKVERTIKILRQNELSQIGMVAIPAFSNTAIKKVKGVTYNLEKGEIVEQKIEKADIVKDEIRDNYSALKFNLPSMKVGSIVHFSYTLEYDAYPGIPDWYFQHSIPTLFSMYYSSIPANNRFVDVSRTSIPFEKVTKESDLDNKVSAVYNAYYGGSKSEVNTWVRRNVPALKEEVYRKGENNYLDRVKIYITGIYSNWDITSKMLMNNTKNFSRVYDANSFANKKIKELTKDKTNDLDKAKAIYCFVRDSFSLANYESWRNPVNLKNTFEKRQGNQIELNQIMITMMLSAGLNAEAVILSLKPDESLNPFVPDFSTVDYLLTQVTINGKGYFLDPSQKYLPFGLLLFNCYNGYSRVMSKKWRETYIDDNLLQDNITVMATVKFDTINHKMNLRMVKKLNDITAFNYRDNWKGDEKKAIKELKAEFTSSNYHLDSIYVENMSNPDKDLKIHLVATTDFNNADKVFLSGYLNRLFTQNPLPTAKRIFPIAFGHKFNYNYYFNLQLPEGYEIEYVPESKKIGLEQSTMLFTSVYSTNDSKNDINLHSVFQTNEATFEPDQYDYMRALIETMLEEQNKNIILKKIK